MGWRACAPASSAPGPAGVGETRTARARARPRAGTHPARAACTGYIAELRTAVAHEAEVSRALSREADAHRYIEETGADEPHAAELEHYYQQRWDPEILADVNALHHELERRLKDLEGG